MIVSGTVDRSKEHIEITYRIDYEGYSPEYFIEISVALVAPYSSDSIILQYTLCPDLWGEEDDCMMEAVQKEINHYLIDLGGELSSWFLAIHRAFDAEVDRDCRVEWTWYPDGSWEWVDNSCWLPAS